MSTEAETVANLALDGAQVELIELAPGEHYRFVTPASSKVDEFDTDYLLPAPRRATGRVTLTAAASLVTYVRKHSGRAHAGTVTPELSESARALNAEASATALYADIDRTSITAVINGHGPSAAPGWGDHRAALTLKTTSEWKHWLAKDRTWLSQSGFAEHIEEGLAEIVEPPAADMLEVAQSLQAHTRVDFKSQTLLANGQRQFTYAETMESKAGQKGTLEIPQTFKLGIIPFEGLGVSYGLVARFQFRLDSGDLKIRYLLTRPADILRTAFEDVVEEVEAGVGLQAFRGVAP